MAWPLYSNDISRGWRVVKDITFNKGEQAVVDGALHHVFDGLGRFAGYQLVDDSYEQMLPSEESTCSISTRESAANAGLLGRSATEYLREEQRLARKARYTERKLPPEDFIERAKAKVRLQTSSANNDGDKALRVYPKAVKMKRPTMNFVEGLIYRHEEFRAKVYRDTRGHRTIAVGLNLDDEPFAAALCQAHGLDYKALCDGAAAVTADQGISILRDCILLATTAARRFIPNFATLPENVRAVVIDMIFNMGSAGFQEFHRLIAALCLGDFREAAKQMGLSAWASEVKIRADEDIALMLACAAK